MREFTAPLTADPATSRSLTDAVVRHATERPDAVALSRRADGGWQDVTSAQLRAEVEALARGLLACGVEPGDRVVLISRTRYEWTLFDYALWWVGAVSVPMYDSSPVELVEWVLADSGATACIAETPHLRARVEQADASRASLEHLWTIDEGAVGFLTEAGQSVEPSQLEERRSSVRPHDLATVVYTSGTTGRPKGCMLTHANLTFEVAVAIAALDELFEAEEASTLLVLPLAHVFARVIQIGCVQAGVRMGHAADVRSLVDDLQSFRPTFILSVPRILENLFNGASQRAHSEGKGRVFDAATDAAIDASRAQDRRRVSPVRRARHAVFDRLVYSRLRASLGGRIRYAVVGGAPLGERLAHYFRGIGLTVLEGYGLTETSAALTANTPDAHRIGTVGRPLPGTSVRLADDGELLFRGGQVFAGYWRNEQATDEALDDDGWLRTGDVGEVDEDGYVRVTGRKKEVLVTAGGKNVSPAALEDVVRTHRLVSQCLVVGEARPYVAALVTLDPTALAHWCERNGKRGDAAALAADPDLRAAVQAAVDAANQTVSQAESIREFQIVPRDWTEKSGHLTPTQKLKRAAVLRDFDYAVQSLYR